MMYSQRFVAAVQVNGKILRENQGTVTLPFGCEYALRLRNLNSRRAQVQLSIDGQDAAGKLVIGPNASIDLQRFIRNGNLSSGNRFKFIERSAAVEAHRGIKADDGLIRAEFWAQKEPPKETLETIIRRHYVDDYGPWYPRPPYPRSRPYPWGTLMKSTLGSGSPRVGGLPSRPGFGSRSGGPIRGGPSASLGDDIERGNQMASTQGMTSFNDAGITVPGSESHQQFINVAGFPLESQSTVIVLQLRGEVGGVAVAVPVTVQHKPTCTTCGKVNKAVNKFCSECGTALVLI